ALDHARQDPLRNHLQAGLRSDAGFGAHAETHGRPPAFAKQFSQPLRDITRWIMRVRIPSVTTSRRVCGPTQVSARMRKPTV
ncbi:hypothetical protein CJ430_30805, partial [Klebsiella pneumoniae]